MKFFTICIDEYKIIFIIGNEIRFLRCSSHYYCYLIIFFFNEFVRYPTNRCLRNLYYNI